jgi:hypothetical protein
MILPIQPQPSSCRQHPLSLRIGESGSCVISSLVRLVLPRTGSLQGPGPSVSCVLRHEFGRSQNSEPLSAALVCRAAVYRTIDVVSSSAVCNTKQTDSWPSVFACTSHIHTML